MLLLGDCDALGDTDALGLTERLTELDGETLADGLTLGEVDDDGLSEAEGDTDRDELLEGDCEADGETDALGDTDGLTLELPDEVMLNAIPWTRPSMLTFWSIEAVPFVNPLERSRYQPCVPSVFPKPPVRATPLISQVSGVIVV